MPYAIDRCNALLLIVYGDYERHPMSHEIYTEYAELRRETVTDLCVSAPLRLCV
jgi:hypothetical protein